MKMLQRSNGLLAVSLVVSLSTQAFAQDAETLEAPLSAIPWLSESLQAPRETSPLVEAPALPATPSGQIEVATLDQPRRGATGLLSAEAAGFPESLWSGSDPMELAQKIRAMPPLKYPALQRLFTTLLLVEAAPPPRSGDALLLARVDALLLRAELDPALALLERAGPDTPALFRRWFDLGLLTGTEDRACATLQAKPDLTPNYATQIFCLARAGRWPTAALTLETAAALGGIDENTLDRLTRFLDPELFEGEAAAVRPDPVTPLDFRLLEAIGEPVPTAQLPLAFAWSDLRHIVGWKSQIEAAERLASAGALPGNTLLGLYSLRKPAASGGVWDRVALIQTLDVALSAGDARQVSALLEPASDEMHRVGLQAVFADMFSARLSRLTLSDGAALQRYRLSLISNQTDAFHPAPLPETGLTDDLKFLNALLMTDDVSISPKNDREMIVSDGFTLRDFPLEMDLMLKDDKLGEALLDAIKVLAPDSAADIDDKAIALAFMKSVGQLQAARHTGLQLILMDFL